MVVETPPVTMAKSITLDETRIVVEKGNIDNGVLTKAKKVPSLVHTVPLFHCSTATCRSVLMKTARARCAQT